MVYAFVVATIIIVIIIIVVFKRKANVDRMVKGIEAVQVGLYRRLKPKFKSEFGEESGLMAVAIINEIFSGKPSNQRAEEFLMANKKRIESEFVEIKEDDAICEIVSMAINIRARLDWIHGDKEASIIKLADSISKLEGVGIYKSSFQNISALAFYLSSLAFLGETKEDEKLPNDI